MPNWCTNRLLVKGMKFDEFKVLYCKDENFTFERVVPIGEWNYDTAIESWGTKWDCLDAEVYGKTDNDGFMIDFQTAWSPAEPVVERLIENHPEIEFKLMYYEPGCDFCGVLSNSTDEDYEFSTKDFEGWDEDLKSYIMDEQQYCDFEEDEELFTNENNSCVIVDEEHFLEE